MRAALDLGLVLAVVAAACGDDGINRIPDNPPPDGMPDGMLLPVTLTITDGAGPREGVVVLFQNADSSLEARGKTDGSGVVSALLRAGGYVTAINPFSASPPTAADGSSVRTFAGVKPGDQLRLHEPGAPAQTDVTFVVPIDPAAASYVLWTSCGGGIDITNGGGSGSGSGGGAPGGLVSLYGCGATIDVVVETRDAELQPLGAIVRTDVPIASTIDLSSETYAATVEQTFTYASVPGGVTTLNLDQALVTARGAVFELSAGADLTAGGASVSVRRPEIAGATAVTRTRFYSGGYGLHGVADWGPPGAYTLDAAGLFLREYATVPVLDVAGHKLTWTASAGAAPDFVVVNAYLQRPDGKSVQIWNWQIAAPYDGEAVVFPVLPADQAELNPAGDDTAGFEEFITMKVPGGYDAVRASVLSAPPQGIVIGASGRAVFQELGGGPVEARRGSGGGVRLFPAVARRRAR